MTQENNEMIGGVIALAVIGAIGAGVVKGCKYLYKKYSEEKAKEEKELWNEGRCPKCGSKWSVHSEAYESDHQVYYTSPTISCEKCNIHEHILHYNLPINQIEKDVWNDGKCPKCGGKWHARSFYPKGSRGEYEFVALTCKHCKSKAELRNYKPVATKGEYNSIYN